VRSQREAYCNLAILVLSQLTTVLARYTHGMLALFRQSRVIHNPVTAFIQPECRAYPLAHPRQHHLIRPIGVSYHVMYRLMFSADRPRINMRGQRFNTLAFNRQHQSAAVVRDATMPIPMT